LPKQLATRICCLWLSDHYSIVPACVRCKDAGTPAAQCWASKHPPSPGRRSDHIWPPPARFLGVQSGEGDQGEEAVGVSVRESGNKTQGDRDHAAAAASSPPDVCRRRRCALRDGGGSSPAAPEGGGHLRAVHVLLPSKRVDLPVWMSPHRRRRPNPSDCLACGKAGPSRRRMGVGVRLLRRRIRVQDFEGFRARSRFQVVRLESLRGSPHRPDFAARHPAAR
jgi:hypothetical protein